MIRTLSLSLLLAGCSVAGSDDGSPAGGSTRDRLAGDALPLAIDVEISDGSLLAKVWQEGEWIAATIALPVLGGEVMATLEPSPTGGDRLAVEDLALSIGDLDLLESPFGGPAQLVDVSAELAEPLVAPLTWAGDDEATAATTVQLRLRWSLRRDGVTTPLAPQRLAPMPVAVTLAGDDDGVALSLGVHGEGLAWAWGDVVELHDVTLELAARASW